MKKRGNLLVVDDEDALLELRLLQLKNFAEQIYTARNSKDVLSLINDTPDLVLSYALIDFNLKESAMDGVELSEFLLEKYPNLKIVMMSGRPDLAEKKLNKFGLQITVLPKASSKKQDIINALAAD
ncbi:MAG: response regulator [Patescibacteria group bacterium]|nr:response regulator [Patescibacteria group bacterium]